MLHQAIGAIARQTSISASLREEVDLFGQHLLGTGTYLQGPSFEHVWRLEMRIQAGPRQSLVQQIADGRRLWLYRSVLDNPQLRKVELARVTEALSAQGQSAPAAPRIDHLLLLGGLPKLLAGLEASFRFTGRRDGQIRGNPVWLLDGAWQPAVLARLLPDQKETILAGGAANLAKLPDHLPERVVLALGKADLFPYRIEFLRSHPGRFDRSRSGRGDWWPIVAIELFDVALNVPIDPRHFVWQAGNLEATDVTEQFVAALKEQAPQR